MRVSPTNKIEYKYYEKATCSNRTVQSQSAMNYNSKVQILSNDTVRRLLNTSEEMGAEARGVVIDQYAHKLKSSGYNKEQTCRILLNGIKNYETRRKSRIEKFGRMRNTSKMSKGTRSRKKLLGKSNWYKKRSSKITYKGAQGAKGGKGKGEEQRPEQIAVLFCDYTPEGELARLLRELLQRMEGALGFGVKVVERTGPTLKSQFPLGNLWEGQKCEREDCTTCNQGAEELADCKKPSVLYENICGTCNPGAVKGGNMEEVRSDVPTLYVGETSRTIYERSREHWTDWKRRKDNSHIKKHQEEVHGGGEEPKFIMKVVRSFKTALSRQVGEAVRIRRRGGEGNILNSKAEYRRSRIPRLVIDRQTDREIELLEEEELKRRKEQLEEELKEWSSVKLLRQGATPEGKEETVR